MLSWRHWSLTRQVKRSGQLLCNALLLKKGISFIACFNSWWYLQGGHWARTATQPLRYASSFSDWRLYIWTYSCLHISFAINFKMQRRASSYAWLLSYWSPYFWDGNHVRIGMSWWYCRIDPICYIILPCQFCRIQRLAILLKVGIIKIALKWHYFCRSTHHMGHTWGWMI